MVEAWVGLFMTGVGEVSRDHGGFALGMAQGALDEPRIAPRFEQRGGGGMPEGMDGHAGFGHAGPVCGFAKGALDTGATHGRGCGRALLVIPAGGGKEPGLVTGGVPVGSQQSEGLLG